MRIEFKLLLTVAFYLIVMTWVSIGFDFSASLMPGVEECESGPGSPCDRALLTLQSDPQDYLDYFGGSDAGSYVRAAISLLETDQPIEQWYANGWATWPPGMYFLNAVALLFDVPLGVVQWCFAATLWALAFALIGLSLAIRLDKNFWLFLPLLFLMLPLFSTNFLRFGVMWSETSSLALLTISLAFLTFPAKTITTKSALVCASGLVMALAALIRAQVFYVGMFAILAFVVVVFLKMLVRGIKLQDAYSPLLFSFGFLIGLAPWIATTGHLYSINYVYALPFTTEPYPYSGVYGWVVRGGMRAACVVDEMRCAEVRALIEAGSISYADLRNEILLAFFRHPLAFTTYKAPILVEYFMDSNSFPAANIQGNFAWHNFIYLLIFITSIIALAKKGDLHSFCACVFLLILVVAIVGPPFAMHYEVRYLYAAKVLMLISPLFFLARRDLFFFESERADRRC